MENINPNEFQLASQESIKLIKNSKGYTWEIKTLDMDLERLEKINKIMIAKFK